MTRRKESIVAAFIAKRIDEIGKTQRDIARECGGQKPNVITMLKNGQMKLPLDKIGRLRNRCNSIWRCCFGCSLTDAEETLKALVLSLHGSIVWIRTSAG
jgi:hypothetical protein